MILTLSALLGLAQACAPQVAPETLLAVARAESGFDPLVIGVNGAPREVLHPANAAAATAAARRLIAQGRSVDLGLGQINNRNLGPLGLSIADAFEPCRNLSASARVLAEGYARAAPVVGQEQVGLRTALSLYNTGDPTRGVSNGYVARVTRAAAEVVPALASAAGPQTSAAASEPATSWDVFARPIGRALTVF